jgi:predicted Rossmann-fold nucleotide-binding protein
MAIRSICVYAGSSPGAKPIFRDHAVQLGRELARQQMTLIYGGASVGLMGIVADAVLAEGAPSQV